VTPENANADLKDNLQNYIDSLGNTLFEEISKSAAEAWKNLNHQKSIVSDYLRKAHGVYLH
jgi:Fe-S cluster biosynthesis and repair protein YggX